MHSAQLLKKEHVNDCAKLIAKAICFGSEPTSYLIKKNKNIHIIFLKMAISSCLDHGLSFVVMNKKKVVACIIGADFEKEFNKESSTEMEEFLDTYKAYRDILSVITAAEDVYIDKYKRKMSTISHPMYLAVSPKFFGKGLGQVLLQKFKEASKEKGYERIYTECTNKFITKAFLKCGAKILTSIQYDELEIDHRFPLKGINEKIKKFLKIRLLYKEERDGDVASSIDLIEIDL